MLHKGSVLVCHSHPMSVDNCAKLGLPTGLTLFYSLLQMEDSIASHFLNGELTRGVMTGSYNKACPTLLILSCDDDSLAHQYGLYAFGCDLVWLEV